MSARDLSAPVNGSGAATPSIPQSLLPKDGRFGSGPSKVRDDQVAAIAGVGRTVLGTSHRLRGGATIRQRWPLPIGATTSSTRPDLSLIVGSSISIFSRSSG